MQTTPGMLHRAACSPAPSCVLQGCMRAAGFATRSVESVQSELMV
jgi:hypothetical protein